MEEDDLMLLGHLGDDLDLLGDDDDDDELGLRFGSLIRSRSLRSRGRRGRRRGAAAVRRLLVPKIPGTPKAGVRQWPLGFPTASFTATSGTVIQVQSNPQRAFKGSRLQTSIARSGATSTGLVTIGQLFIGQTNQLVSAQPINADAFTSDAVATTMSLDSATPGVNIVLQYILGAPALAGGDTVDVGSTLFGVAVG